MHPAIVKNWILPAHERLLRRGTLPYLRRLHRSQWWPASRLREYQACKLRRLLRHARSMCPFYRDRIADSGIDPDRATLEDLPRLPTLNKTDIRDHKDAMIDPSVPGGLFPYSTGGSTGDPLRSRISVLFSVRRWRYTNGSRRMRSGACGMNTSRVVPAMVRACGN